MVESHLSTRYDEKKNKRKEKECEKKREGRRRRRRRRRQLSLIYSKALMDWVKLYASNVHKRKVRLYTMDHLNHEVVSFLYIIFLSSVHGTKD